ncbi:MAG TPA: squalene/phytoene synthase family protein [Solirubrobacteraceae bacterium]
MQAVALELAPEVLPSEGAVMERAGGENFPVAMRVLSRAHRRHLLAVYGFARLADELGDELVGDRLAALDRLEQELDRAYAGSARHPLLVRLQQTLAECALPREAFMRLIDANRLDQRVVSYDSWEQLQAYCELSANPVGELVLCVFDLASPERIELSNRVCTALQLAEHLQDLREDVSRGRFYLPARDLASFDCSREQLCELVSRADHDLDLRGVHSVSTTRSEDFHGTARRLCEAISFETTRSRGLLAAGVPLVAGVPGRPKLALAGFVAGGRAALDAIERARFDVLAGAPRASRRRLMRTVASVLAESCA